MKKEIAGWLVLSVFVLLASACKSPGVTEVHPIPNSFVGPATDAGSDAIDAAPDVDAGPCPAGWSCMDLAKLGFAATDADGRPVAASCGMGGPMTCDDADPSSTCKGLTDPFCAHLEVGGQTIVSCAQRCSP